jgi:formate hydrogenlyase transcriptional activator
MRSVESDYWRTLLDVTNAVVTKRDLGALRAAIAPNVRRIVAHDHTNLFVIDNQRRLQSFVIDPTALAWPARLSESIHLDAEPYKSWLSRVVDIDVDNADPAGWEAMSAHIKASGVRRICNAPLLAPHGLVGVLSLGRLTPAPFTPDELARVSQVAAQIAIALENATAFDEIAALKEQLVRENVYLKEEIRGGQQFEEIVGESKALQQVLNQLRTVAATDTTVLLLGETGTGKELLARAVHAASDRQNRALVTVNCTTSPAGLLESEWFGHERGAFTGALAHKIGRFELAHQGTLFLDEIGDVPIDLQSKLLRVLQEHEIERLGSTRTIRVDFRLIAATNRNLEEMVGKREFRSDLYYRLNVFPIRIPPLRERPEDIPPLVFYFAQRFAKRLRRSIESVSRESLDVLCRWPWPGNVRELQNVIERAVILSKGPALAVSRAEFEAAAPTMSAPVTLEDAEREHILRALADTNWVIGGPKGAAARLGVKRTSLVSTMRRLHIARPTAAGQH